MNMLLFAPAELIEGSRLRIEGERATHMREVLKVGVGSAVRVGELGGGRGQALVCSIAADHIVLEVQRPLGPAEQRPRIDLALALPRPQSLKKILQDISAIGVDSLTLFASARVEKSYFHSPLLKEENLSQYVRLGLEQGMSTAAPQISIVHRLRDLQIGGLQTGGSRRSLLLHPGAAEDLLSLSGRRPFSADDRVQLVIGPEGGFRDEEVLRFIADGCEPVCLLERVLRVETAVCVGLGQLSLFLRS